MDRSAARTGSRPLRASTGVARISQTTASASGAKGTPTYGITVAGFQACGHSETKAHLLPGGIADTARDSDASLWRRDGQREYKKCPGRAVLWA